MKWFLFFALFSGLNFAQAAVAPVDAKAPAVDMDSDEGLDAESEEIAFDKEDEEFLDTDEEILFAYVRYLQSEDLAARDQALSVEDEILSEVEDLEGEILEFDPADEAYLKAALEPKTPAPKKEAKASTASPKTIKQ